MEGCHRSGCAHHHNEGREHVPAAQRRACRGSDERSAAGRDAATGLTQVIRARSRRRCRWRRRWRAQSMGRRQATYPSQSGAAELAGRRQGRGAEADVCESATCRRRTQTCGYRNYAAELTERSFARLYETGGMRRLHLRGRDNILKRLLVHGAAFNLSPIPRRTLGVGKPRQLQGACSQLSNSFSVCSYGAERENGRRDGGS
jgi:hypothetical protein